ncbi:hypothetical protein [Helicobacter equorum]|uniref:hypothetical protein n=1 Tax=Helicobacter equorum TaxID=361872 RepID=UPI000CF0EB95|nr:hypothetical protein [Helicobacter equorum]
MKKRLTFILVLSILSTGCVRIIKEPVYIPTKCEITPPLRPIPHKNTAQTLQQILIYTQKLERDLAFCTKSD